MTGADFNPIALRDAQGLDFSEKQHIRQALTDIAQGIDPREIAIECGVTATEKAIALDNGYSDSCLSPAVPSEVNDAS